MEDFGVFFFILLIDLSHLQFTSSGVIFVGVGAGGWK